MQCVTLSLFRFDSPLSKAWAFSMMGFSRAFLPRVAGLTFWKLCGTGTGEGFTPRAYPDAYAILCCWHSEDVARARLKEARPFPWYTRRAAEQYTLYLAPVSARGNWAGVDPFHPEGETPQGPLAALTRATVRLDRAARFWTKVPDISKVIGEDPNVVFKIGIGEVPLLHQVTFSIWPDTASMARFARHDGPHARAIKAVRDGNWFKEELYARFRILGEEGTWAGDTPLSTLSTPARSPGFTPGTSILQET